MEPIEFLKTAELLKSQSEQAHLRTSVGRSYYAAFLFFREHLKTLGLEKTIQPSMGVHAFVTQCLQYSKVSECIKAAQYLRDLQQIREDADYHIEKEFKQSDAEDAYARVKLLLNDFSQRMTPEKEKTYYDNAKAFAKLKCWI